MLSLTLALARCGAPLPGVQPSEPERPMLTRVQDLATGRVRYQVLDYRELVNLSDVLRGQAFSISAVELDATGAAGAPWFVPGQGLSDQSRADCPSVVP